MKQRPSCGATSRGRALPCSSVLAKDTINSWLCPEFHMFSINAHKELQKG